MTITHEPVHIRPRAKREATADTPRPRVDVHLPRRNIRIDQTFWQHRSIFAGSQEQLDQLRREADQRAAARALAESVESLRAKQKQSVLEAHRPAFKRLKPIVHVGFVPLLWTITTCRCGQRWPCNDIKKHLRHRFGWTADITEHLKALTDGLPKPSTRWTRLFRRRVASSGATGGGVTIGRRSRGRGVKVGQDLWP